MDSTKQHKTPDSIKVKQTEGRTPLARCVIANIHVTYCFGSVYLPTRSHACNHMSYPEVSLPDQNLIGWSAILRQLSFWTCENSIKDVTMA